MGVKSILARAARNLSKLRDRARIAPARPLPPVSRDDRLPAVRPPLEGVIVADLTQNVAGPFCAQILGDMGAEVIKVERPGRGDDARAWAPPRWGDESSAFMAFTRNKRSLALDLKQEAGLTVLRRLVARADVFLQSLRAGVVA